MPLSAGNRNDIGSLGGGKGPVFIRIGRFLRIFACGRTRHVLHVLLKFHIDMKKNIFAVAAVAAMLCACGGGQQKSGDMPEQDGSRTGYALAFFRNTAALSGADENMMVSPYSAGVALSMLADGAEDQTRAELLRALGGSVFSGDILHADSLVDVRSANSAWIRSGFDVKDSYEELLRESYGAMVAEKDFSSGSTVGEINRWCSDNTEGRITEIIDRISPDMVMFLVNALYFKAPWEHEFRKESTSDKVFHGSAGDAEVPMMYIRNDFRYASYGNNQIVELPYEGGRYSMLVALPAEDVAMQDALPMLTEEMYDKATGQMTRKKVALTLPKFRFETDLVLNDVLRRMGVERVFSGSAQLGGISDASIAVDQVRQKCFIEVNEQGSEAAAVTGIGVRLTSARPADMPVVMTVDRPFYFAIVDNEADNILFIGRVMNLGGEE